MLDDDGNGINGGMMQITKQTHVANLTMFTSAVAQLLNANAIVTKIHLVRSSLHALRTVPSILRYVTCLHAVLAVSAA